MLIDCVSINQTIRSYQLLYLSVSDFWSAYSTSTWFLIPHSVSRSAATFGGLDRGQLFLHVLSIRPSVRQSRWSRLICWFSMQFGAFSCQCTGKEAIISLNVRTKSMPVTLLSLTRSFSHFTHCTRNYSFPTLHPYHPLSECRWRCRSAIGVDEEEEEEW